MSANPVNSWDMIVQAITESTLGTTPAPADIAAHNALCVEAINCNLGPAEVGVIRPKQDRSPGRGMQSGWVEGRVQPAPWSFDTSIKSRADADDPSLLLPFWKACGFAVATSAATSVTLTPSAQPFELTDFAGLSLRRFLGQGLACREAETLRGCVARSVTLSGAAGELMAKFQGVGIGKTTATGQAGVQGKLDSITVANNSTTTITISAQESMRMGLGYYLWESEVILVTACTPGGTSATITRGALGSTAAAHTSKPIVPYCPTPTYTGSPIAEPTSSLTLGGIAVEARSWSIELGTGLDLREPATGSRYSQGALYKRYEAKLTAQLVLTGAQVSRIGDVQGRTNMAVVLSQGSGAGGIFTFNAPYAEVEPFQVPDTAADIAIVDVSMRLRDNTGSDMWSVVLT